MNFFIVLIKSLMAIIVLFFLTKVMGRKQISQMNMYDYIVGITIGSVVAEISTNLETNFFYGIIAMLIFTLVSMFITIITEKSIKARRFIIGVPTILIENGKILTDGLKLAKLDINDLLQEARVNNHFDISKIEYALMEPNGRISFLVKSKYNNLTPNDMKVKVAYEGLCSNLIIDGVIMEDNLKMINKDKKWLITRLEKQGYKDINNILLVICDAKEKLTIYEKLYSAKKETALE